MVVRATRLHGLCICTVSLHPAQLWVYISTIKSFYPSKSKLLYHNESFLRTDQIQKSAI